MYEFYPYKHHSKLKQGSVLQKNVIQEKGKTFQFRADTELRKRIEEHCTINNLNPSKYLRDIITADLDRIDKESWEKEIAEY